MPNTLTSIFVSNPATEPVEAPHPNTGVYVTGTQATAGGPWTVVHTLITKTSTPLTMVGRLKNFPTVTVSVVASGGPNAGNIFNNVLATPTGAAANGTSSSAINVTVNSVVNLTAYRLLAGDAAAGPFTQLYQGTTASYPHTGLAAGQVKYYRWQYVGGGFYDDSPVSAVFSGTATATAALPYRLLCDGDSTTHGVFNDTPYPTLLATATGLTVLNQAVSGRTSQDMLTAAPTNVDPLRDTVHFAKEILTVIIGINDIRNGVALATLQANIQSYVQGRVTAGFTVVVGTLMASTSDNDPALLTMRQSYNAYLLANAVSWGAVAVCDLPTEPRLNQWLDQVIFQDGLHPNTLGNNYEARRVKVTVDSVLTGFGQTPTAYAWPITATTGEFYQSTGFEFAGLRDGVSATATGNNLTLSANGHMATTKAAGPNSDPARLRVQVTIGSASEHYVLGVQGVGDTYAGTFGLSLEIGGTAGVRFLGSSTGQTPYLPVAVGDVVQMQIEQGSPFAGVVAQTRMALYINGAYRFTRVGTMPAADLQIVVAAVFGATTATNLQLQGTSLYLLPAAAASTAPADRSALTRQLVNWAGVTAGASASATQLVVPAAAGNGAAYSLQNIVDDGTAKTGCIGFLEVEIDASGEYVIALTGQATAPQSTGYSDMPSAFHINGTPQIRYFGTIPSAFFGTGGTFQTVTAGTKGYIQVDADPVTPTSRVFFFIMPGQAALRVPYTGSLGNMKVDISTLGAATITNAYIGAAIIS